MKPMFVPKVFGENFAPWAISMPLKRVPMMTAEGTPEMRQLAKGRGPWRSKGLGLRDMQESEGWRG